MQQIYSKNHMSPYITFMEALSGRNKVLPRT